MKLNDILIEDLEMYKDKVSDALASPTKLYRGASRYSEDVKLVDPYAFTNPRQSISGNNTLNLWLKGDPAWASYPPRDRGVSMSTSKKWAGSFGPAVYTALPFNNAILGICSVGDMIDEDAFPYAFHVLGDEHGYSNSESLADYLNNFFFKSNASDYYTHGDIVGSYANMTKYLKWLENFAKEKPQVFAEDVHINAIAEYLSKTRNYVQAMSVLLSPEKNQFKLISTSMLRNIKLKSERSGQEVWTDSPCFLVRE